jgi:hypothetical protein
MGCWQLGASLHHGVVRLLAKVAWVPTVAQLRPIPLLCTYFKLLTKMIMASPFTVLPSVMLSTQMCSVQGSYIFDEAAAVLLAEEFLHRHKRLVSC